MQLILINLKNRSELRPNDFVIHNLINDSNSSTYNTYNLKKYNKILEFKNATYFVPETTVNPSQKSHYYTREEETE